MNLLENIISRFLEIIIATVQYILATEPGNVGDLVLRLVAVIGSYNFFVMPIGRWIYQNIISKIKEYYDDVYINISILDPWSFLEVENYVEIFRWILISIFALFFGAILTIAMIVGIVLYLALFASIILFFAT